MLKKRWILLIHQEREIQVWWMPKVTNTMKIMKLKTLNMLPFTNLKTFKSLNKDNKQIYSNK